MNAILELARAAGLAQDWTSAEAKPMKVAPEVLARILEALGLPCASPMQCRDSHAHLDRISGAGALLPMVTVTAGQPLRLAPIAALAGRNYRVEFEGGGHVEGRFPDRVKDLQLAPVERPGYHRLFAGEQQTTLAVAPPRCFGVADALNGKGAQNLRRLPRVWGLAVQLYSLRRDGDGGLADYRTLEGVARQAAEGGAAALAISPVHAMFSADVARFGPYGPSSRLFFNALHIDPGSVLGPKALEAALARMAPGTAAALARLEQEKLVDWAQAAPLRLGLLRRLFQQFLDGGERRAFDAFLAEGGEALRSHARFEALHGIRLAAGEDGNWHHWPEALRDPRGAAVDDFARDHAQEVEFHAFLQWQAARGLALAQQSAREAGMPIGLVTDLAVGADNGGSQAWSRQNEILSGLSVGAPPDQMNPKGQSWGLGAFSPHAMKAQGFHAYIEMLRAAFAYAGGVRIDHVLGLARLWLVPEGASPQEGAYLHYPFDDLKRLVALESWRHRAIVIGEDLGTVPPGFDQQLSDAGLLGIRVLLFQRDSEGFLHPKDWPDQAIATTTTHDLPTIAGWWKERDIDWRSALDLLEIGQTEAAARAARAREREVLWDALQKGGFADHDAPPPGPEQPPLDAVIAFMAATPAPLAMLPLEDALGLVEQPNLPGTIDDHPNWRRRLPAPVDALLRQAEVVARLHIIDRTRSLQQGE
jgi:4-alpha-glucanotransferase